MQRLLLLMSLIFLVGCQPIDDEQLKEEIKEEILADLDVSNMLNEQLEAAASKASNCSVSIDITLSETSSVNASGVLFQQSGTQYHIITNEHVLRYGTTIEVYVSSVDTYFEATIEDSDAERDLAILSIASGETLTLCTFSEETYQIGHMVLSVGTPVNQEYVNRVTLGVISAVDTFIQHDAAINPGNSGGGLFNLEGDLIGINTSKLQSAVISGQNVILEGMGFAIPVEDIIDYINETE